MRAAKVYVRKNKIVPSPYIFLETSNDGDHS